ncbi:MAG TPA: hypothetical protein PKC30_06820 [Saprospiraceae bacterium]|nr:hypothetical protein [Saprospiraceae bacterium]
MKTSVLKIVVWTLMVMMVVSCATRKRKEDVKGFKKFYHNMTSEFNGYFNANEIMKEVYDILENAHEDNYSDILAIYPTNNPETAKSVSPQLDIAIEKVTTVATIHDVGDWVDDCYVLMGTAQYLKQDFEAAQQTFEFFTKEYNPDDPTGRNYKKKALSPKAKRKQRESAKAEEKKERLAVRKEREKERAQVTKERQEDRKQQEKDRKETQKVREKEKKEAEKIRKKEAETRQKERQKSAAQLKKDRLKARKQQSKSGTRTRTRPAQPNSPEHQILEDQTPLEQDTILTIADAPQNTELVIEDVFPQDEKIEDENHLHKNQRNSDKEKNGEGNNSEDDRRMDDEEVEDIPVTPKKDPKAKVEKTKYHDGVLMLALTYVHRERYTSADYLLQKLWEDPTVKKEVKREVPAAQAFSAIAQKKYNHGAAYLELAIENTKKKKNKARYAYILAQLEERTGRYASAADHYKMAKKYGATYEMELNSELNMIKNDLLAKNITPRSAEEELLKLRRANKNEDHKDRISFILSDIAFISNQEDQGIQYLREALGFSKSNKNLKREAYFKLAEFYYKNDDFISSKHYYDSTLLVLDNTDIRFKKVQKMANNLDLIARHLTQIQLQDSLLAIAALPEEEMREYAIQVIKDKDNAKEKIPITDENENADPLRTTRRSATTQSSFFAYNKQMAESGKQSFKERWGDRPLQDNWRRKEATGLFAGINADLEIGDLKPLERKISEDEISAVLRELPTTPESAKRAHIKIEEGLYELGKLFRDNLSMPAKSLSSHDDLLRRYPAARNKLPALYYMYLNSQDLHNYTAADQYRLAIIKEFPQSNFAKILEDPNYASQLFDKDRELITFYDRMYQHFENKNFQKVKELYDESLSKFGQNHALRPKFSLLHAMALGNVEGEQPYVDALQDLIRRYPNTPEQTRAREILRFLKGDQAAFQRVDVAEVDGIFEKEDDKLHYMVIVLYDIDDEAFNNVRVSIANYNKDMHKEKRLQISDIGLNKNENSKIILVRKFNNKSEAMLYYYDITKNAPKFIDVKGVNYETYPVTQRNYRKIIDQKGANKYRVWFENHYLASN